MKPFHHGSLSSKAFYALHAIARNIPGVFAGHGLITCHAHNFTDSADFQRATGASTSEPDLDWQLHVILWAAQHAVHLGGCIVECGTNLGYRMRAVSELCPGAQIACFDTWNGFDPRYPASNPAVAGKYDASAWARVQRTFDGHPNVGLIRGCVPESLISISSIGFLHIDMNCVKPEIAALRHFWPDLIPGSIVISDDYGHVGYEAQREAWDEAAWKLERPVLCLPTGQGLIIK